jgi:hypothetical protein
MFHRENLPKLSGYKGKLRSRPESTPCINPEQNQDMLEPGVHALGHG